MARRIVFGLFQAKVRIIDKSKRDRLSRMLFEESRHAFSGEKLGEKLEGISLNSMITSSKNHAYYCFDVHGSCLKI